VENDAPPPRLIPNYIYSFFEESRRIGVVEVFYTISKVYIMNIEENCNDFENIQTDSFE
jgi:hypothetical protein